jgi:hypothetical protein
MLFMSLTDLLALIAALAPMFAQLTHQNLSKFISEVDRRLMPQS